MVKDKKYCKGCAKIFEKKIKETETKYLNNLVNVAKWKEEVEDSRDKIKHYETAVIELEDEIKKLHT